MKMKKTYFSDSVSDLCQGIIDKVDTYEKRIKYLGEENKKLKEEHYKDSEMQRMEAELEKAKDDLHRGFPISKEEEEKIKEWQLKHDAEKHVRLQNRYVHEYNPKFLLYPLQLQSEMA